MAREKEQLEVLLKSKESEIGSLHDELESLKRIIATGRFGTPSADLNGDLDRSRFEQMKQLYEASVKREENLRQQIVEESSKNGKNKKDEKKEDKKDYKKRVKDPAEQAAILYDKLGAKDAPEDRCYKYYLLFSYPDKVIKATIKTIAHLQVDLNDMNEFYSLVNPAFTRKFDKVLDSLSGSKTKDAQRAAEEFGECLKGLNNAYSNPHEQTDGSEQQQHQQVENPDRFEIPVEIYPGRNIKVDTFEKFGPGGWLGGHGGGAYAAASASAGGAFGGAASFVDMPSLNPMHEDFYSGQNPYANIHRGRRANRM